MLEGPPSTPDGGFYAVDRGMSDSDANLIGVREALLFEFDAGLESFEVELSGSTYAATYRLYDQDGQSLKEGSLEGQSGTITLTHTETFHAVVFIGGEGQAA